VNPSERAAFDALVGELDGALSRLGEPPVRDNPAFSIEPDWLPEMLCVTAKRDDSADFRFTVEGCWVRVDIAGLDEALLMPLPGDTSRAARKHPPISETLDRLISSSVTLRYQGRRRYLLLTDSVGQKWGRNKYYGHHRADMPKGFVEGEAHEFAPLCPPRA
jgi:hypothetical protein